MVDYHRSWKDAAYWAETLMKTPDFAPQERDYKIDVGNRMRDARQALMREDDWYIPLVKAFGDKNNNLYNWREFDHLKQLSKAQPRIMEKALKEIWDEELDVWERFEGFFTTVPDRRVFTTSLISVLHLAMDVHTYPPFKPESYGQAQRLMGVRAEKRDSRREQSSIYVDALEFLDRIMLECSKWDVHLRDRLDAQAFVWMVGGSKPYALAEWDEQTAARFERFVNRPVSREWMRSAE